MPRASASPHLARSRASRLALSEDCVRLRAREADIDVGVAEKDIFAAWLTEQVTPHIPD